MDGGENKPTSWGQGLNVLADVLSYLVGGAVGKHPLGIDAPAPKDQVAAKLLLQLE